MDQMTVYALYKHLESLIKKDPTVKSKKIVISDDNEGNGYHGLFYGVTTNIDSIKEITEYIPVNDSTEEDPNKIVLLG